MQRVSRVLPPEDSSTLNLETLPPWSICKMAKYPAPSLRTKALQTCRWEKVRLAVARVDADPQRGGVEKGVAHVIYPGSRNGKPRGLDEIASSSREYFRRW